MKAKDLKLGQLFIIAGSRTVLKADHFSIENTLVAYTFMNEPKYIDLSTNVISLSK